MKKSQPHRRPLQLHKDTVRALDPVALRPVAGGLSEPTDPCIQKPGH